MHVDSGQAHLNSLSTNGSTSSVLYSRVKELRPDMVVIFTLIYLMRTIKHA